MLVPEALIEGASRVSGAWKRVEQVRMRGETGNGNRERKREEEG